MTHNAKTLQKQITEKEVYSGVRHQLVKYCTTQVRLDPFGAKIVNIVSKREQKAKGKRCVQVKKLGRPAKKWRSMAFCHRVDIILICSLHPVFFSLSFLSSYLIRLFLFDCFIPITAYGAKCWGTDPGRHSFCPSPCTHVFRRPRGRTSCWCCCTAKR